MMSLEGQEVIQEAVQRTKSGKYHPESGTERRREEGIIKHCESFKI
jgi:hypothetical protein